jgi:hypothetical protein
MDTDLQFDTRLVDRHIAKGTVTREDYEKHLKGLKDAKDKATNVDASQADNGFAKPAAPAKKA